MAKSSELFEHAQIYIREVMADRLRSEGFVSYKSEDIHWYRLVNNEVIQTIYFVTRHKNLHSFFDICYGSHPLFIPPIFQKSPYFYAMPSYEQMNNTIPEIVPGSTPYGVQSLMLYGSYNRPYRFPDSLIMCPKDKNNGLDILEQVFPFLDSVNTPRTCYEMHKDWRADQIEKGDMDTFSSHFVDEVLFWEDKDLYELCKMYIDLKMYRVANLQKNGEQARKSEQPELDNCIVLNRVFRENCQHEYVQTFPDRVQKTLELLKKYTTIRVGEV